MFKIKTYLAAPLFNEREQSFNRSLASLLSVHCDVFLPQRDGLLLAELISQGIPTDVAETRIFERDRAALNSCKLLVAVLDGAHVDEGVAFEIGFAFARDCLCLGFQSDARRALPSGNNPMIGRSLSAIFSSTRELSDYISHEHSLRAYKGTDVISKPFCL